VSESDFLRLSLEDAMREANERGARVKQLRKALCLTRACLADIAAQGNEPDKEWALTTLAETSACCGEWPECSHMLAALTDKETP
jgi:hypothetical protein